MGNGKLTKIAIEVKEFSTVDESYENTCKKCDFSKCLYCPFTDGTEDCGARYFKFIKEVSNEKF